MKMKECVDYGKKNCQSQNDSTNNKEDKEWFQILVILISCLPSLTFGFLFSWPSPSIPQIVDDEINFNITLEEASYFSVIPPLGTIISCLFFVKLNNILGRKYVVLLTAVPYITSLILLATAKSVYIFYLSRFMTGIGDACLYSSLPMYLGEIATPKVRGIWGNAITFEIYLGQFLVNLIGSYANITITACIMLVFPTIFLITFIFMPESPYYSMMKNKEDQAKKSLQRLRRKDNVNDELLKLKNDVERQMSETGTWKDLFVISSNRRALYAGIFLRTSQQFCGISGISVYTQLIFLKAGGNLSASTSTIILTGLFIVLNFFSGFVIDRLGRRLSYLLSLLLCGIFLLCLSIYFYMDEFLTEINMEFLNWLPVTVMILYVICFSFGLGVIPTLMLGELFSVSIKSKGLCFMNIIFAITVSTTTKLFNVFQVNFGLFAPFLFFSVCCFISTLLSLYFVPETKGKTLEEIQQGLKTKK